MSPYIPRDVTDLIIESIPTNSSAYQTLRACTLVCHDWFPASQRRLFRDILIHSPHCYIRFIEDVLRSEAMRKYLRLARSIQIGPKKETTEKATFRLFLCDFAGHMPNIEDLTLTHIRWTTYLPIHGEPLLLSKFPSLKTIALGSCRLPSVNFLRHALMSLPELRGLKLYNVTFEYPCQRKLNFFARATLQDRAAPALESLCLAYNVHDSPIHISSLLTWLGQTRTRRSLRGLQFVRYNATPRSRLPKDMENFFKGVAPCVTHLHVDLCLAFPIASYTGLLRLDINLSCYIDASWAAVAEQLREVSHPLRFLKIERLDSKEAVALALDFEGGLVTAKDMLTIEADRMEEINSALSGEQFEKLEVFCLSTVTVSRKEMEPLEKERILAFIRSRLPRLYARSGIRTMIGLVKSRHRPLPPLLAELRKKYSVHYTNEVRE